MKDYKAALNKVKLKRKHPAYVPISKDKPRATARHPKLEKPRKLKQVETWALYGLNKPPNPRYTGLKGIYWYVVSEYVRKRDHKMWGRCISCNKKSESWKHFQAGHFISAGTGGFELLFDLENINAECGYCNGFDHNHLVGYEINLDKRYGKGSAAKLKKRYLKARAGTPQKAWNDKQYDAAIRDLQGELVLLE